MGTYESYGETVALLRIPFLQPISRLKLKLCRTFIKIYFGKANKPKRRNFSSYISECIIRSTGAETGRDSPGGAGRRDCIGWKTTKTLDCFRVKLRAEQVPRIKQNSATT